MAARAQRRREANRDRKNRLERRRQKKAEATRVKHEGPSLAEVVRANVAKRRPQATSTPNQILLKYKSMSSVTVADFGFPRRCGAPLHGQRAGVDFRQSRQKAPAVNAYPRCCPPPPPPPLAATHAESVRTGRSSGETTAVFLDGGRGDQLRDEVAKQLEGEEVEAD